MSTTDISAEIRSFQIEIPEEQIDDLRRRIAATRWPTRELVNDRSQGVHLAAMRELARYWRTDYDWHRCEARLNASRWRPGCSTTTRTATTRRSDRPC